MKKQLFNVLLIEDDAGDALLVDRCLSICRQQFVIQHCESLEDALKALANNTFDVALLDLSLPDSSGLSGLTELREASPDTPIVVLTGCVNDELALESLEKGAQDYLVKGDQSTDLLEQTICYAIQRQETRSENRRLIRRMEVLVRQDPLTGVLNRQAFGEALEAAWQSADDEGIVCAMLDIDFFKRVNDTYGHAAGDRVLVAVANILCSNTRARDAVGRMGGEEFCVLLAGMTEEDATRWARRVREKISAAIIISDNNELSVTASIGLAAQLPEDDNPKVLIDRADEAMFAAKQLGRDRVIGFRKSNGLAEDSRASIWRDCTILNLSRPVNDYLSTSNSVKDAFLLLSSGVDSIPVLDDGGDLVGVFGENDVIAAALTNWNPGTPIGELMQTQVVTFSPETSVKEVCEFLCRSCVRQVFVRDAGGKIGIIGRGDFVRWLNQYEVPTHANDMEKDTTVCSR